MQSRRKRMLAIARESIRSYGNNRSIILFCIAIFLSGFIFYFLFLSNKVPINHPRLERGLTPQASLLKLEDSIAVTNKTVEQLDIAINKELQTERPVRKQQTKQVSEFNKQLLIKKIDAILRYLKTPLNQFNQLPAYFINNPDLEQQIKAYNTEQVKVANEYQAKSKYDTSFFDPLRSLQHSLVEKLNAEKDKLIQQPSKQKVEVTTKQASSKKLRDLLRERDSMLDIYAGQLERYQKKLDNVTAVQLSDPSMLHSDDPTKMNAPVSSQINTGANSWLFVVIPFVLFSCSVPFFIILFKKVTSPFVKRIEDIELPGSEKFITVTLNENVNEELIAFNYEHLVKEVKRLKKRKHAVVAFYSVGAGDQREIISRQLGLLLSKLGNLVLSISILDPSDTKNDCENIYPLSDFMERAEIIKEDLLKTTSNQLYHQLNIKVDSTLIERERQTTHGLRYYWALQHHLTKTTFKRNLSVFKKHFNYVIIDTPDFLQLDSSLLFIPSKSINIHVFRAGKTERKFANLLCRLNENESTPTVNIIDFSQER
jgi:hypothetical protein